MRKQYIIMKNKNYNHFLSHEKTTQEPLAKYSKKNLENLWPKNQNLSAGGVISFPKWDLSNYNKYKTFNANLLQVTICWL